MKIWHVAGTFRLVVLTLLVIITTPAAVASQGADEFRFRVLLDEKEIGHHHFTVTDDGEREIVEIDARFDVRLFFVPVYRYRHSNKEVWRNGCLTQIRSRTDDNGEDYQVAGELRQQSFALTAQDESRTLREDCVMTFAYWRRDFLEQPRLLNAQTGKMVEVDVQPLQRDGYELAGEVVPADGYRIRAREGELDIRVWYARDSGRLLALESTVDGNRTLTYLPQSRGRTLAGSQGADGQGGACRSC